MNLIPYLLPLLLCDDLNIIWNDLLILVAKMNDILITSSQYDLPKNNFSQF